MEFATEGIVQLLTLLTSLTGNLGLAILVFTFLIRSALLPLSLPTLKATQKMRELQPEIKKLKKKYGKDKEALQKAQMDLYKKYNVNPLAGCIPQLLQFAVLIFLYRALLALLNDPSITLDTRFLWLNLTEVDKVYILPVLAAVSQLVLSIMIAPGAEKEDRVPNNSKSKKIQQENEKEEDVAEMAQSMQQQMMFIMPIMTGFFALRFPSGLALYWVATTLFSIGQQYYVSGWGGITTYSRRILSKFQK